MIIAIVLIFVLIVIQVSLNGWREGRNRKQYRRRDYHDIGRDKKL